MSEPLRWISVVIPALNEEACVAAAVASARAAAERSRGHGGRTAVRDGTREEAAAAGRPCRAPPGRGVQLDAGARRARATGSSSCTRTRGSSRVGERPARRCPSEVVGGAFRFAVDSPRRGYRCIEAGVALRCRLFRLPYGDQGIFVAGAWIYEAAGGFPPLPLMEDVAFVCGSHEAGRLALPAVRAFTSRRRWERSGLLATTCAELAPAGALRGRPATEAPRPSLLRLELTRVVPSSRAFALRAWPWAIALSIVAVALPGFDVGTRDPDSRLYAEIAAAMAAQPVDRWIAPLFPPGWYMSGYFREHPVGVHLLPALLGKLGYPAPQAAFAANALYQVLSLVLLQRVAAALVGPLEARSLGWLLQLIPIAFTFRIRANHEQAILLCLLLALYG